MLDQTSISDEFAAEADAVAPPSIAVVGMSGRFPKASDLAAYWDNLASGRDCITRHTIEELVEDGINPMQISHPRYVPAKGTLDEATGFDAVLFGFSPREAEIIDPQQRAFLECALAALEDAGIDPDRCSGAIGVFGGQSMSSYIHSLMFDPRNAELDGQQVSIGNDKDFLTSRTSYKLNLKGPSVVVQSACSTSLVAVSLAYQSLLDYGCDVALAGGVCITFPEKEGYLHEDGSNYSPDGYCRAFDARPSGLVGGNGVGIVVLKRLEDAIADRDHIHAVIRGASINNDGSVKVGYTAPSVDGQAEAISTALALGDVDPATIGYVEAHGTATRLGDPIEVAALTKAYRQRTDKVGYCGIGSVKSGIGHLDAAAGMAGMIKAILAMQHGVIPPTLHVEATNPQIDFESSPFYVATSLKPWIAGDAPRRAGISSFGIGGTNAHVVIEEAPAAEPSDPPARRSAVLTVSAGTASALKKSTARLAAALRADPGIDVHDAAHTLQSGRKAWRHRVAVVCSDSAEAVALLDGGAGPQVVRGQALATGATPVAFLFPGQGAQHVGMALGLYEAEPAFRALVDECAASLRPEIGLDIRDVIFGRVAGAAAELDMTRTTQPALFTVEYSLARLWMSWGVTPTGMLGHSIGEYVAACIAGVMTLPDALRLVARRGALMQSLPGGAMASVPLPAHELEPVIGAELSVAAVLGPRLSVVAGPAPAIAALEDRLSAYGVEVRPIRTSHAFHSAAMDPILERFAAECATVALSAPAIPFVSNLSGTWITDAQATDPRYWAQHLRGAVRLSDGLVELTAPTGTICLEVGPGHSLGALARGAAEGRRVEAVATCRDRREEVPDTTVLMAAAGRLWAAGAAVDWPAVAGEGKRNKVPLPTYPFERKAYSLIHKGEPPRDGAARVRPASDLLYAPRWRRAPAAPVVPDAAVRDWLVFVDAGGFGTRCAALLGAAGQRVTTVGVLGEDGDADHRIAPGDDIAMTSLLRTLEDGAKSPDRVLHLWGIGGQDVGTALRERVEAVRARGFDSLVGLAKALGARRTAKPCLVTVASTGLHDVCGEAIEPEKALLLGPVRVIPVEYEGVGCRSVDLSARDLAARPEREAALLIAEADLPGIADAAFRNGARWTRSFDSLYFDPHGGPAPGLPTRLKAEGVYLVTGGLGGVGLAIAKRLAERVRARLILVGRSLPQDGGAAIVAEIAALGGQALVVRADVANRVELAAARSEAEARFGPVQGVVHAAGVAGRGILQTKAATDVDRVFAPKVDGTLALDEAFAGPSLDFFVACSSVSTVVGAPGQAEYTAANAFQDSFAVARRAEGATHVAIDWDRWAEVGMAVREMANQPGMSNVPPWATQGLETVLGVECFEIALDSDEAQIAVALDNFEWISRYGPPRAPKAPAGQAEGALRSYERPEIDTVFAAPGDATEVAIAGLFQTVLGIKDVGVDDNFFDLGGHSLLGVKLVNGIQDAFGVDLGIGELFGLPTVRSLARTVATRREARRATPGAASATP